MSRASGAQKKRKEVVRKESRDPQEYQPYKQKGTDLYVDENEDVLTFVPSAVSSWAGWRECDERCCEEGFHCWDIVGVMVEEDGELCTTKLILRPESRNEPRLYCKQWERLVGENSSRGKLAVGLRPVAFEQQIKEIYAGKKMYATNLPEETATALKLGSKSDWRGIHTKRSWFFASKQESAVARHDGAETIQSVKRSRRTIRARSVCSRCCRRSRTS